MIKLCFSSWKYNENVQLVTTQIDTNVDEVYHNHDFFEIFYICEGTINHIYNNENIETLITGDVLLIRPSDAHMFKRFKNVPCKHTDVLIESDLFKYACDFLDKDYYDKICNAGKPLKANLSKNDISRLEDFLLQSSFSSVKKYGNNSTNAKIFLVNLLKSFLNNITVEENPMPNWLKNLTSKISVVENLKIGLPHILDGINYNRSYVCRTFKKYFNCTISEYLLNARLDYASILLKVSDYTNPQICDILGFESCSYFIKKFKNAYGLTPKQYKNSIKQV